MKSENERLRALLAEARGALTAGCYCGNPWCLGTAINKLRERIDAALAEPVPTFIDWPSFLTKAARERDEARAEVDRLQRIEMERDRAVQAMKLVEALKDAALRERDKLRVRVRLHQHTEGMHSALQGVDLELAEVEIARLNALVPESERSKFKTRLKNRPDCSCGCGAKA